LKILLTNDDGIFAPGLAAIYKELARLGDVTVVAPTESCSGASHSVTIDYPLVCNKVNIEGKFSGYSVQGLPADCVKLAALKLHEGQIDLLVAGINNGANIGINVYYSGTVAAAMEGAFLKIPSVAMSMATDEKMDYENAAGYCAEILKELLPIERGYVININIPQLTKQKPKGIRVVPQSTQALLENYDHEQNEKGQTTFQLTSGMFRAEEHHNDVSSIIEGFITITALTSDMTNYEKTARLKEKIKSYKLDIK